MTSKNKRAATITSKNKRGQAAGETAVRAAKRRGMKIINHGAGIMPVGAAAPHGGTRYHLLVDSKDAMPPWQTTAHDGKTRDHKTGGLIFTDAPTFRPVLTPHQMISSGIFGGCYFNPKGGKAGIFGRNVDICHSEFPAKWFADVPESMYLSRRYNKKTNCYGVKSGTDQAFWESKGWIHERDPRGWFQWYCRFFMGRRTADDERQIGRWSRCAGPTGRWRGQLCGQVLRKGKAFDDVSVSPVIRQTLLHWAYKLELCDWEAWCRRKRILQQQRKLAKERKKQTKDRS